MHPTFILRALFALSLGCALAQETTIFADQTDIVTRPNAKFHNVSLGKGGPDFSPDSVNVQPGDNIRVIFYPGTHGVAQSYFSKPCEPTYQGIYSGNVTIGKGLLPYFDFRVNDSTTIWLYSTVGTECAEGAAMVINEAGGQGETLPDYKHNARNVTPIFPTEMTGGTIHLPPDRNITNTTATGWYESSGHGNVTSTSNVKASDVTSSISSTSHEAIHTATVTHSGAGPAKTTHAGAASLGQEMSKALFVTLGALVAAMM